MPELITYKKIISKFVELGFHSSSISEALNLLYKDGFISYPRTDDEYLPMACFHERKEDLERLIESNYNDLDFIHDFASKIDLQFKSELFVGHRNFNHSSIIPTFTSINFADHPKRSELNYSSSQYTGFIYNDRSELYVNIYTYIRNNYIQFFIPH